VVHPHWEDVSCHQHYRQSCARGFVNILKKFKRSGGGGPFEIICGNGCPLAAQVARDGGDRARSSGRPPGHGKLSAHRELLEDWLRRRDITLPDSQSLRRTVCRHAASIDASA